MISLPIPLHTKSQAVKFVLGLDGGGTAAKVEGSSAKVSIFSYS